MVLPVNRNRLFDVIEGTESSESIRGDIMTTIETIVAALPHVPEQIADMLILQVLTGLSPSEVCNLTAKKVKKLSLDDRALGFIQKYLPGRGKERHLFFRRKPKPMTTGTYSRILADAIKKHGLVKFTAGKIKIDREQIAAYMERSTDHPFVATKRDRAVADLRERIVGSIGRLSYYVLKLQEDIGRYYEFLDRCYEETKFDEEGLPCADILKTVGYESLVALATETADLRALPLIVDCIPGKLFL
jgi:hypothetical protein